MNNLFFLLKRSIQRKKKGYLVEFIIFCTVACMLFSQFLERKTFVNVYNDTGANIVEETGRSASDTGFAASDYLILAMVLLLGYGIINGSTAMKKTQTSKESAIMRSMGARKSFILRLNLFEGALLGGCAGLIGSTLAYFVLWTAARIFGDSSESGKNYQAESVLLGYLFTVVGMIVLCLVSKYVQTKKLMKLSIANGLENLTTQRIRRKRKKSKRKNPVTAYIMTSLKRNRGRVLLCIGAFTFSIGYFVCMTGLTKDIDSLTGFSSLTRPYYDAFSVPVTPILDEAQTEEILRKLCQQNGIEEATVRPQIAFSNIDEELAPAGYRNQYALNGSKYASLKLSIYNKEELENLKKVITDGTTDISDGGCILVNYCYEIDENGDENRKKDKVLISNKKVGDTITITDITKLLSYKHRLVTEEAAETRNTKFSEYRAELNRNGEFLQLPIRAIAKADIMMEDQYYPIVIISEEYFKSIMKDLPYVRDRVLIKLSENAKLSTVMEESAGILPNTYASYFDLSQEMNDTLSFLYGMMYGTIFVSALVGILNVLCLIIRSWDVSKKEYAILKSLGATTKRLIRMILVEKTIICLTAMFLGIFGGVGLNKLILSITFDNVKIPFELPITEILLSVVIMVVITLLATFGQSRILNKLRISEVLRDDTE